MRRARALRRPSFATVALSGNRTCRNVFPEGMRESWTPPRIRTALREEIPTPATNPRQKTLYLNGVAIGSAATWEEVAALLSNLLGRSLDAREAQNNGSESVGGFHIELKR
jgi:hypothetical protein